MRFLHRHPVLEARSVEAARKGVHLFRSFERYEAVGDPARFHLVVNSVLLDGVRLGAVQTTGHCLRPVDGENATLLLAHRGSLASDDGREPCVIRDGEGALLRPGARTTTIPGPYVGFVLQAPLALLAARAGRNGEDGWHPKRDWPSRPSGRLVRALRYVIEELDAAEPATLAPRVARGMSQLLADLMLDDLVGGHEDTSRPTAAAGRLQVQRAEALLRERARDAISIVALAGELGISTRSLQAGFQRHLGMTPRDFLAACRLDAVRERLTRAQPGETVTTIAYDCGVTHLGRFAAAYRRRYGEPPSATLARSQRTH